MARPEIRVLMGEAVGVLRRRFADASFDMVYLDPPFGTQQDWTAKAGSFSDKFSWDRTARRRAVELKRARPRWAPTFDALPIGDRDRAYLAFVGELALELRRVMRPSASIWFHCDDTMGAYIRLLLDAVFGPHRFLGTVIWKRTSAHGGATRGFGRVHDSLHVYGRGVGARGRLASIGAPLWREGYSDVALNPAARERVGYPTQKPVRLLEQVIEAGSKPGDTILDPTCGSGTTLIAALRCDRQAVGIDRSNDACRVAKTRLRFAGKTR